MFPLTLGLHPDPLPSVLLSGPFEPEVYCGLVDGPGNIIPIAIHAAAYALVKSVCIGAGSIYHTATPHSVALFV